MRLLLAERPGERRVLLAGCLFFMSGRTVTYAFNGRRREQLWLRPNEALHWQAVHDASREGYEWYDLGGSTENPGLAQFKSKWGAEARPLRRYHFPDLRDPEAGVMAEGTAARRAANQAWRRLPLGATALLGDWLYTRFA
jgi:hypothetical protein